MGLDVTASYWTFKDTGITALDPADLERIDPPYGYSRAEFAAEERVGKALGQEINLDVSYGLTKHVDVFANGAVFLPPGTSWPGVIAGDLRTCIVGSASPTAYHIGRFN
jgi:hypothetical protein